MMLRLGKSLTARLTLLFAAVSSSVLLVLGLVIAELVERHFQDMDLELLEGKLALVQHAVLSTRADGDFASLPGKLDAALVGHHGLTVGVWGPDGRRWFLSGAAELPQDAVPPAGGEALPTTWKGRDGQHYRGLSGQAPTGIAGEPPATVLLSTNLAHHEHFMQSFRLAMWTVVSVAAVLSGFLGWVAARRGLAPLRRIARRASDVTASNLGRRIEAGEIPVELDEVVSTLNAMLGRLKESFDRLSGFSSDIAHELRTPVSNLLTQTQVMLARVRSAEEYQDVLASNAEELERLSRTIADMLFLAKADNGLMTPTQEYVNLGAEISGMLEFYEAVAEERHLQLALQGQAGVRGDRLMLRRALGNLLANAIRHTPEHGSVRIALASDARGVCIHVENTGETISPEHLPRLFDRFYRADPARHHAGEGSGLGLAITKSIALAHRGEVSVRSRDGVTVFSLCLPAPEADSPQAPLPEA